MVSLKGKEAAILNEGESEAMDAEQAYLFRKRELTNPRIFYRGLSKTSEYV
ncbi:hypothetical protein [Paenibacillus sp. MER TA 81-3]|uniref:hypothetical protein n=1 Tax=Paenibacillus sp. MER TA 81-3 TaxID=2939573 RepID=UPI00203F1857|nr:hypothetical protein [Paenibacillus sp. MER TA 81-3]